MKRISSGSSLWYKRILPVLWFGIIGFIFMTALFAGAARQNPVVLVMPCVMLAVGYFVMKHLVWDLVDEVLDDGDALLVRKGATQERVRFSNIMNVSATLLTNPRRITLRLVTPGVLGEEISFVPATIFSFNAFRRNAIADDLALRAYRARTVPTS